MVRLQAEETHPLPFFMIITAKRADSGRLACSGTGAFGGVTTRQGDLRINNNCRKGQHMRLDKYLKVSRLIKRRSVANEACDGGRVLINDKPAKASANVKEGDIITISFGNKEVKVEVLDVQETVRKEEAGELFRYI